MTSDGRYLLSVGSYPDKTPQTVVYDMQAGKVVRELAADKADFSGSNDLIVLAFEGKDNNYRIEVRDIRTNKLIRSRNVSQLFTGYNNSGSHAHSLMFLDDGKTLAFTTLNDPTVTVQAWDLAADTVRELVQLPASWGSVIDIRPALKQVFTSAASGVDSFALDGGADGLATSKTKPSAAFAANLSPDKKTLAIIAGGSGYDTGNRLWVMDLEADRSALARPSTPRRCRGTCGGNDRGPTSDRRFKYRQGDTSDRSGRRGFRCRGPAVGMDDDWIGLVDLDTGKLVRKMKPANDVFSDRALQIR